MSVIYNGIMGLVVGDALGVPVEFKKRDTFKVSKMIGYGTYNQPPGTWSDDSSMTLATLESMGRMGTIDPADIMENFSKWAKYGDFTPYGELFDIGGGTQRAISRYCHGTAPVNCGGKTRMDNGNGALMRILPVAMVADYYGDVLTVARLTHAHFISTFACAFYTEVVRNLMEGENKDQAVAGAVKLFQSQINEVETLAEYRRLPTIQGCSRDEIRSSGYVVDTLEAALWCFLNTNSYRDCVLTAVNLGEDTDTVAAVAGGLAGIYYGCGGKIGIPTTWIAKIPRKAWIKKLCDKIKLES